MFSPQFNRRTSSPITFPPPHFLLDRESLLATGGRRAGTRWAARSCLFPGDGLAAMGGLDAPVPTAWRAERVLSQRGASGILFSPTVCVRAAAQRPERFSIDLIRRAPVRPVSVSLPPRGGINILWWRPAGGCCFLRQPASARSMNARLPVAETAERTVNAIRHHVGWGLEYFSLSGSRNVNHARGRSPATPPSCHRINLRSSRAA